VLTLFTGVKIPPSPHSTPFSSPIPLVFAAGEGRNGGFAAGGFAARRKTPLQSPFSPGRRPRGEGGTKGVRGQEDLEMQKVSTNSAPSRQRDYKISSHPVLRGGSVTIAETAILRRCCHAGVGL